MTYPAEFLKGIPNKTFMDTVDYPASHLFYWNDDAREDGFQEQSGNWNDDAGAITLTLDQRKVEQGEFQFQVGVAVLIREEIDRLKLKPQVKDRLEYERKPLQGNGYHGNLLLREGTSKALMRMIAAGLALCVDNVVAR